VVEKDTGLQSQKRWVKHPASCSIINRRFFIGKININKTFTEDKQQISDENLSNQDFTEPRQIKLVNKPR